MDLTLPHPRLLRRCRWNHHVIRMKTEPPNESSAEMIVATFSVSMPLLPKGAAPPHAVTFAASTTSIAAFIRWTSRREDNHRAGSK